MPHVIMMQGVPMAGAYRAPIGRVLAGGLGWLPNERTPTLRQETRAPRPVVGLGWMPQPQVPTIRQDLRPPRPVVGLGWLPEMRVPTIREDMHAPRPVDIRMGRLGAVLGRAGIRGMCDDDGWLVANAVMTGVGAGMTNGATTTQDGQVRTDAGVAAIGAGMQSTANAWRQLCAAQNQQAGDPTAAAALQAQLALQQLRHQMDGNASAAQTALYQQQAAAAQAAADRSNETMKWVGIGMAGLAGLGLLAWALKGKRRR